MKNARGIVRITAVRRRARRAAVAIAIPLLAAGLVACTAGAPKPIRHTPAELVRSSDYTDFAVGLWNAGVKQGEGPLEYDFDGVAWAGDPRDYGEVCGVTLTVSDGSIPFLDAGQAAYDEWDAAHPGVDFEAWLEADPARAAAFNAWLRDPAVLAWNWDAANKYLAVSGGATPAIDEVVGPDAACPDAHEKVRALRSVAVTKPTPAPTKDPRQQAFDARLADYYSHHDKGTE